MAQEEKYNSRDRAYSAWHRRLSTQRFVGIEKAQLLAMIDLDASLYVEYDDGEKEPLALIETARDVGQAFKPATVTRKLAERTSPVIPAFVLLYSVSDQKNRADPQWNDISSFRVKRLWPNPTKEWKTFTPKEWADFLVSLRAKSASEVDKILDRETEPA